MKENFKNVIYVGILIVLIVIAFRPVPEATNVEVQNDVPSQTILLLDTNRIAIITTYKESGNYGDILVLEYHADRNEFSLEGRFNYSDYIRNPHKYK